MCQDLFKKCQFLVPINIIMMVKIHKYYLVFWLNILKYKHKVTDMNSLLIFHVMPQIFIMLYIFRINYFIDLIQNLTI